MIFARYEADSRHAYAVRYDVVGEQYVGTCPEYPDVSVEGPDEHEVMAGIIILVRVLDEEKTVGSAAFPSC